MYINTQLYQFRFTPLTYAAWNGHLPMVEYLVERGADMEAKSEVSDGIVRCEGVHTSHVHKFVDRISVDTLH